MNESKVISTLLKGTMLPVKLYGLPTGKPSSSILMVAVFKVSVPLLRKVIFGFIAGSQTVLSVSGLITAVIAASTFTLIKSGITCAHHVAYRELLSFGPVL